LVLAHQGVQLFYVGAVVALGLGHVNVQAAALHYHQVQVGPLLHHKAFGRQQYASGVPQGEGQGLAQVNGVDVDDDKVHGWAEL
jgi:hypothetical protein